MGNTDTGTPLAVTEALTEDAVLGKTKKQKCCSTDLLLDLAIVWGELVHQMPVPVFPRACRELGWGENGFSLWLGILAPFWCNIGNQKR